MCIRDRWRRSLHRGQTELSSAFRRGTTDTANTTHVRAQGGGFAGYSWQSGQGIFGIEADASLDSATFTTAVGNSIFNQFQSTTGRLGLASYFQ